MSHHQTSQYQNVSLPMHHLFDLAATPPQNEDVGSRSGATGTCSKLWRLAFGFPGEVPWQPWHSDYVTKCGIVVKDQSVVWLIYFAIMNGLSKIQKQESAESLHFLIS